MIVAVIPARGGSKGVPRKNIRPIAGHPLIAHSILQAKESSLVDQVYVSTEDGEIADVARRYGAEIIPRPDSLAVDEASSESALDHALSYLTDKNIRVKLVVFLQCTSPIRNGHDIDNAVNQLMHEDADSLLTVCRSHRFLWQQSDAGMIPINYDYRERPRRQDMTPQYIENGSIYIFKPWVLKQQNNRLGGKIAAYVMDETAGYEIDSLLDFEIVELIMNNQIDHDPCT